MKLRLLGMRSLPPLEAKMGQTSLENHLGSGLIAAART